MRVVIPESVHYAEDFIQWLVERIQGEIFSSCDLEKLYPLQKYQEKQKIFKAYNSKQPQIDFRKALVQGVKSITYRKVGPAWVIEIPQNIAYKGYYTTLYSLCKFIDKGNNDVVGYPIFSKTLNRVSENVSRYYNRFLKELII